MTLNHCNASEMLTYEEGIRRMLQAVNPVSETEPVTLHCALDRILAQPLVAPLNVPGYDNSAMDGYALRKQDASLEVPLQVIGTALAGHPFTEALQPGTCIAITTGAPIPAGADCVVMKENTHRDGDKIFIRKLPQLHENIRNQGEDIAQGTIVLPRGQRLGPVEIGLLASLGMAQVDVFRRLKVAVFSTGDELTPPGNALPLGHIYDSNRYALIALLQRLAVEVIDLGLIPDQPEALRLAFQQASEAADAIISSGGVSVGDADLVKDILREQGEISLWKLAIKPGKPFAFGKLGQSIFFGLPGNPVSALVTLHQVALPALRKRAGEQHVPPLALQVPAAINLKKQPGRMDFQRGHLTSSADGNRVVTSGAQGSGILTSFTGANCYIVLERERGMVEAGESVTVLPFDRFIS